MGPRIAPSAPGLAEGVPGGSRAVAGGGWEQGGHRRTGGPGTARAACGRRSRRRRGSGGAGAADSGGGGRQRRYRSLSSRPGRKRALSGALVNRQNRGCCGVSEGSGMRCREQRQTEP
ncbi:unnamed protein product [Coccothraustes coccothraustes]